jgi:phage terminase large subunit
LRIQATRVFNDIHTAWELDHINGLVLPGSSRSSKTHSIVQALYVTALQVTNKRFVIARSKRTWVKATTFQDFKKVFQQLGAWDEKNFNKSELIYRFSGNTFEFIGLDENQKLHGLEPDFFWCNESMELHVDDFDQIEQRLLGKFILDFNPTDADHWIYHKLQLREDIQWVHSTFKDNPFLPQKIVDKINSYEPNDYNRGRNTADEYKWKVYGLGLPARREGVIYENWELCKEIPKEAKRIGLGLDFGFTNDPTACIDVYMSNGELWLNELIYEEGLTNQMIAERLTLLEMKSAEIVADSAEPKSIREIEIQRFRIEGAEKGPDSINNGIDVLKRYKINVTESSINLIKELKNYTWAKDRTGKTLNKPVDNFNHALDAVRYVALNKINKKYSGNYTIF